MEHSNGDRLKTALLLVALGGLLGGLALHFGGQPDLASTVWLVGVVPALAALLPAATGHQPTLLQGNQT